MAGGLGAEYFYGFLGPGVSQWYPPLWENTTPVRAPRTPEEGYHLEADMADRTIAFIQRQKSIHPNKPWMVYYAPSAHKPPVGVPREWITKYRGRFDDGYDKLRERTPGPPAAAGDRPGRHQAAAPPPALPAWADLSETDKQVGARSMEVFCAAVEYTDYQIGRIVEAIEATGELDNTLIIYLAGDNGPTPEGGLHGIMNKLSYCNGVQESLEDLASQIDDFGLPGTHGCYPAAWAYATSTPFTYGKEVTSGGGCSNAAVVSWPARITDQGGLRRQFHHLIDLAPTILESAGVPEPERVNGIDQQPMHGISMVYTFDDPTATDRRTTQYFELLGGRAIYHDGWWAGTRHGEDGLTPPRAACRTTRTPGSCTTPPTTSATPTTWRPSPREAQGTAGAVRPRGPHLQRLSDVDDLGALLGADRPKLVAGDIASYGPGTIRLPEDVVINIKNRSFSLLAEVDNPDGKAEGMLVTLGGETGGYALLVLEGKPTFIYNFLGLERSTITSSEPIPRGPVRSASTSPTTAAAWVRAARARCRSTTPRWPRAGSRERCRSSSRPTTPSMWVRTGARRCRRPTSLRSGSPAPSRTSPCKPRDPKRSRRLTGHNLRSATGFRT